MIDKDKARSTIRHRPIKHQDIRLNMRLMSMAFTVRGNALLDKDGNAAKAVIRGPINARCWKAAFMDSPPFKVQIFDAVGRLHPAN